MTIRRDYDEEPNWEFSDDCVGISRWRGSSIWSRLTLSPSLEMPP